MYGDKKGEICILMLAFKGLMQFFTAFESQYQNTNSPSLFPDISHRTSGEKLVKYQDNLSWMIISLIPMTSLINNAFILQG